MKQEILVKVEHMNKRFGSTVALKDVSIEVCSGRVLGLIGENGSGKSTVTSIIAGMQNADSGTMTYHDKEWKPESMLYSVGTWNWNDCPGNWNSAGNYSSREYIPWRDKVL